jgi:hypothetical protein
MNPAHTPHTISLASILILSSYLRLGFPRDLFPSGLPAKTLYAYRLCAMRSTCPSNVILLDLIIVIFKEEYKLCKMLVRLCEFLEGFEPDHMQSVLTTGLLFLFSVIIN